jgi:hypothetical protein
LGIIEQLSNIARFKKSEVVEARYIASQEKSEVLVNSGINYPHLSTDRGSD